MACFKVNEIARNVKHSDWIFTIRMVGGKNMENNLVNVSRRLFAMQR